MSLNLYVPLKAGYKDQNYQKAELGKFGYNLDTSLSNGNQQTYYNPNENKLLFNVAGTHNLSDVGTDFYLGIGKLKDTNRFKEADNALKQAKSKYKNANTTITGHSLGSSIASYLGDGHNDKIITLDKGSTIGQNTGRDETDYRTSGDLVSLLGANATHTITLQNPHAQTGNFILDGLNAHNVDNIKSSNILI
jgi:hypothetical protein